jgi:hypothetical protein
MRVLMSFLISAIAFWLLSESARSQTNIVVLSCEGTTTYRGPGGKETQSPDSAFVAVNFAEGKVYFKGDLIPITQTTAAKIEFGATVDEPSGLPSEILGTIDRITGDVGVKKNIASHEFTIFWQLHCKPANHMF